jgi:hypothetical protein
VSIINPIFIKLASHPYRKRSGLIPLLIAVGIGWVFVGLWSWVALLTVPYNLLWAGLVCGATIAFAGFLGLMTHGIWRDANKEYEYELNSTEAVLTVFDKLSKRKATKMILMDDVKYAEYYPYLDSACLILHSPAFDLEVPLWPLGSQSQDVLDFLDGRGILVMNVQMDDTVPVHS